MNKNKGILSIVGFTLTALGILSIVLSVVGVKFSFLSWIDAPGPLFGLVFKLILAIAGIVILYIAQSDFRGDEGFD